MIWRKKKFEILGFEEEERFCDAFNYKFIMKIM